MTMLRRTKFAFAIAVFIIGVPITAMIVLLNFDWNRAKPWLNARTSDAIGRPFAIGGELALTWHEAPETLPAHDQAWRAHIPWPHLVAKDIHIGNPATMIAPQSATHAVAIPTDMASIGEFSFSLNPFALFDKTISIPVLRFESPLVFLQRTADGKNNWTFHNKSSSWKLNLQRIVFTKGKVHLVDAVKHADLKVDIDTLNGAPGYGVSWKLQGNLNGESVSGNGKAGAILALQQQMTPYPIAANVQVGNTSIALEGTLTKPAALAAFDMRLKISGASMARLYPLTGMVLPETPRFFTEGHLLGTQGVHGGHWIYDKFSGKVGSSDIGGTLAFQSAQPRDRLTGTVNSRLLHWSDLSPLIGADSNASKAARGAAPVQPSSKVLPVETFKTERWTSIDADVSYSAEKIIRGKDLPISKLNTHCILKDGVLSLIPLNFDIAGGKLASDIKLDGSGKIYPHAIGAELKISARHLRLQQLLPTVQQLQASKGEINGEALLSATGNSVASLLGSSNGQVKTLIDRGTVSKLLLEEMGLNIGNVVLAHLFGDKQVKLNCMASDFVITKGLMRTRSFIVDTEEAILNVSGNINLSNEQLDLTLRPDSKGLRIFSLRAPLYLRGTLKQPDVSIDKGVLALRAGSALALATLAPLAALIPLINTGPDESSGCATLLTKARVKPVAPPPGKTMRAPAAR